MASQARTNLALVQKPWVASAATSPLSFCVCLEDLRYWQMGSEARRQVLRGSCSGSGLRSARGGHPLPCEALLPPSAQRGDRFGQPALGHGRRHR